METITWILIIGVILHFSPTEALTSWTHTTNGLKRMVLSSDKGQLFVTEDSTVFQLDSVDLTRTNNIAELDGTLTVMFNIDNDYLTVCTNNTRSCVIYNSLNLELTNNDCGLTINNPNASVLVTREKIFIACPHRHSYDHTDTGDDSCKNPGISWKKFQNGRFQDLSSGPIQKFIKFKTDEPPIVTERYIASFAIETSRLFFSRQRRGSIMSTRVAHMCQTILYNIDNTPFTYVDMEISCGGSWDMIDVTTVKVDDVVNVVAVFYTGDGDKLTKVCIYTYFEIKERLKQNYNVCLQGNYSMFEDSDYIQRQRRCGSKNPGTGFNLCEGLEAFSSVVGIHSLNKEPVLSIEGHTNVLAVSKQGAEVVAFLGTTNGQIKKAVIIPSSEAREIPFNVSLGKAVQQGMYMDRNNSAVLAFTDNMVFKIPVQRCEEIQGCKACLGPRYPLCGWCILDNRCSIAENCTSDWIPAAPKNRTCPTINSISKRYLAVTQIILLELELSHLPSGVSYSCRFNESTTDFDVTVGAVEETVVPRQLKVQSPDMRRLAGQIMGLLKMQVSILTNVSSHPLAVSHITYYSCETFTSCNMCTQPQWKCRWCIYMEKCESTKRSDSVCSDTLETASHSTAVAGSCPNVSHVHMEATKDKTGEYFMSHDLNYTVKMFGSDFPQPLGDMDYSCKLSSVENVTFTAVYRADNNVDCIVSETEYQLTKGQIDSTISLYWGQHLVDGLELNVYLYRCEYLTKSCDKCKSYAGYQPHYLCHWCSNSCQGTNQQCENTMCPPPSITQVFPISAAVNSSIILTINGTNLGSNFTEVIGAVSVGDMSCAPIDSRYVPAESISCELDPSLTEVQANVSVSLPGRQTTNYRALFNFRVPEIYGVFPTIGPMSGGTRITVSGRYLNTGINRIIYIDESMCHHTQITGRKLTCVTEAVTGRPDGPLPIGILFDNGSRYQGNNVTFQYLKDPEITGISPRHSYQSGGRNLTVSGTNLHVIQKPAVFARFADGSRSKELLCFAISSTEIKCPSPPRQQRKRMKRAVSNQSQHARLGFKMDGVSFQGLPENIVRLEYFQDPTIQIFQGPVPYHDILVIKGERLAVAADQDDVLVYIGNQRCNITSLKNDSIYCNPPMVKDTEIKESKFQIRVKIGYLTFIIGHLDYEVSVSPVKEDDTAMITIIIVTVTSICIIMLAVLLLVLFKFWKNKKRTRKEKSALEFRLDKLEATFRTQCREEFAALQMAVSDLTSDLEGGNALFRDYSVYANKTLFASSMARNTLMTTPPTLAASSQQALDNFKALLRNTQFLLLFIRTMEKQKSFDVQDKSNVATILMVLNHDNLEFITDILKTLLNELVDKNVAAQTPKLMLRRSEKVSEKLLTHWLSVCLYHYLKTETGSPLYFLYKAIKTQIDKGPVDYITCCGKYTLSEDKLFTASDTVIKNEPKTLTLEVSHFNYLNNEEKQISASVLDCDTITQAKSKMLEILYKNVPFSQRPPVHKTLLEIEENGATRCINDEDASSIKEGLWKKINTLQHYGIEDGTKARLSHTNEVALGTCNNVDASPDFFIVGSYRKSRPVVRTISGSNYWHLTKQNIGDDEFKISSDFFLPRLISTKGTLQTFIDDLFTAILHVGEEPPIIIKYIYDFLDAAAARHGITDPEVLHTWKCNSVILRFWVNIMKNPEFVFDIHKPQIVDSCLSVVAQTLMDSCSTADLRLGPHSPSNKLLFAKDIPRYKQMVKAYFEQIQAKPAISDQELNSFLTESVSQKYLGDDFNINSALLEMYRYAKQYKTELMSEMDNLEASSPGSYFPLISKLEGVLLTMDKEQRQEE